MMFRQVFENLQVFENQAAPLSGHFESEAKQVLLCTERVTRSNLSECVGRTKAEPGYSCKCICQQRRKVSSQ